MPLHIDHSSASGRDSDLELPPHAPRFQRVVSLRSHGELVRTTVCDNVHEFTVEVRHDGARVTEVAAEMVRIPWTTCPGAAARLQQLVGAAVGAQARTTVDQQQQCTHLLDLARLAIRHAGSEVEHRFEIEVRDGPTAGVAFADIRRDGRLLFGWTIEDGVVTAPEPFAGHLIEARAVWTESVVADPDLIEAGMLLRRCVFIHRRRPESFVRLAQDMPHMRGACYTFQPERVARAERPASFADRR